jgi:hypothetical protein
MMNVSRTILQAVTARPIKKMLATLQMDQYLARE